MSTIETQTFILNFILNAFRFLCEDSFTQMKRSNAHEVTLRAVLDMFCIYVLI